MEREKLSITIHNNSLAPDRRSIIVRSKVSLQLLSRYVDES
jgi:hypothetical protein